MSSRGPGHPWSRLPPGRQPRQTLSDRLLAAAWLATCEAEILLDVAGDHGSRHWPPLVAGVVVAAMTAPAAWRRRVPVLSGCLMVIAFAVLATWGTADVANIYAPLLALFMPAYSMAAYARRSLAVAGLAVTGAAFTAALIISAAPPPAWILVLGSPGASWLTGRAVRSRRRLGADLVAAQERLAAGREARERLAVAEQRAQIAAELEVLVAQCLSDMMVQAAAIEPLIEQKSERLDTAMASVEATGRQALTEMRRILGVLRREGAT